MSKHGYSDPINEGADPDDWEYTLIIGEDDITPAAQRVIDEVLAWFNARYEHPGVAKSITAYNGGWSVEIDAIGLYDVVRTDDGQIYVESES